MKDYSHEGLSHDPIHGYIPFTTGPSTPEGEVFEGELIDHPWIQRLRQIHQLQTAWWVFPTAEHTRFQHVLGVMHLASRVITPLYESLATVSPDVPSLGYVESLMRLAGLLHDVGHGPFGHFLDEHFLGDFGLTHETLGSHILKTELAPLLTRIRRNPNSKLADKERIDPAQIAFLITRPQANPGTEIPRWLLLLRGLFSGLYTVDNMDFVLRDAYMSGYNARAFDLDRLLHYSFFSEDGLTLHHRGMSALARFIGVRAELFRSLYFHRTVRAIDLSLADLFRESKSYLFPGNPLEHLDEYLHFTEWSLLNDTARWEKSHDPRQRELGVRWTSFLRREVPWRMACERTLFFAPGESEKASIFSDPSFVEAALRKSLPTEERHFPFRVDLARHVFRPGRQQPTAGQNFLFDPSLNKIRPITESELLRYIPQSFRICRVYVQDHRFDHSLAQCLDTLLESGGQDDRTNM